MKHLTEFVERYERNQEKRQEQNNKEAGNKRVTRSAVSVEKPNAVNKRTKKAI